MNPHKMLTDPQQIADVESIKRLDKAGHLYQMNCSWNYYNLPKEFVALFDAGCSAFTAKNLQDEYVFYRNYDYSHRLFNKKENPVTGLNCVVMCSNPAAKYKSVGVADAFWIDFRTGSLAEGAMDDGKTDLSFFPLLPYLCMDGMNETGLTLSILALPVDTKWEEIPWEERESRKKPEINNYVLKEPGQVPDYGYYGARNGQIAVNEEDQKAWVGHQTLFETKKPGLPTVVHPMLMRYILDKCSCVDEAVALARNFNVKSVVPGSAYHVMVADSTGKTVLLEWVGDDMHVMDINHTTNFYVSREDHIGGGVERDEIIEASLRRFKKGLREDLGVRILSVVAQNPENGNDKSKTQYSCVYNMAQKSLQVFSYEDFEKSWTFKL